MLDIIKLIYSDNPILALELAEEKGEKEIAKKIRKKLDHYFNHEKYLKKYKEGPMDWRPDINFILNTDLIYDRHNWIMKRILSEKHKSLIDLGCYEGGLVFGSAARMAVDSFGVDICDAVVKHNNDLCKTIKLTPRFAQGRAETYKSKKKYDAVVCCEVIEHVKDPKQLIDNMCDLVTDDGWCYLTTPDGCYDLEHTIRIWETEKFKFDHIRSFNKKSMKRLLKGKNKTMRVMRDGLLYVRFQK